MAVVGAVRTAMSPTARATVSVVGPAAILCDSFQLGRGTSVLRFAARSEVGGVRCLSAPELSGELHVDLRRMEGQPAEILLLENQSQDPIQGAFRKVRIWNPNGAFYELSYRGGDGNDLVAMRSAVPVDTYAVWQELHFPPDMPEDLTRPRADADGDRLPNAAEYAMGRSPMHPEGAWMKRRRLVDPEGVESRLVYQVRTDRQDVRLIPQWKENGQIWRSGLNERVVKTAGEISTVSASLVSTKAPRLRIVAELQPDAPVPNVLFVLVDDLNDWVGCLQGHPQTHTPNIDRLASRGLLFRGAHASATICNPSRVSLLTGVPPSISGLYRNPVEMRTNTYLTSAVTLPEHFKHNGYLTFGSGKFFHDPDPQSWHEYWPDFHRYRPGDPRPAIRPLNGIIDRSPNFDWGAVDAPQRKMGDHKVARWIGNRIQAVSPQEPFFAGCGFFRPHLPFYAPSKYFERFEGVDVSIPGVLRSDEDDLPDRALKTINFEDQLSVEAAGEWQNAVKSYLASITFMDEQLGRLLDALDASPHGRNTVIVFTSDHGFMFGQKMHWRKQVLWSANTHVPLIVVAPGITTPGTVCDAPVCLVDLFPTLVELAGLPDLPAQLKGQSLVPQLEDPSLQRAPVLTSRRRSQHAVFDGRYKLITYGDKHRELYDTMLDPHEWYSLSDTSEHEATVKSLMQWLPE